jgi:galactose mutarotase-like enzyme
MNSHASPRNHGCRISDDWFYKGMQAVVIENDLLRVTVLVGRGSDIVEFRNKPMDLDYLYFAPSGVRNPGRDLPSAYTDSPYLDYFSGGWNEILPNGGPVTEYQGAVLGQHGETSLLPWKHVIVKDTPEIVSVKMWVRTIRTPFLLEKTLTMYPGKAALQIDERVTNEGGQSMHFMWGQHIAFGRPFLEEGAIIDTPAKTFFVHESIPGFEPRRFYPGAKAKWPKAPAYDEVFADASKVPAFGELQAQELAYLTDMEEGWYAITNPLRKTGFAICFDPGLFRYIWYWQQMGNVANGYPWWGRTHTAALEPWSSFPSNGLQEAIKNGSALYLKAGEQLETSLTAFAYTGLSSVTSVTPGDGVKGRE